MKILGISIIVAGILLGIYALNMDTSLYSSELHGRFNNIGLMNDKQNYIIISGILSIIGVILFFMIHFMPSEKKQGDYLSISKSDVELKNDPAKISFQEWSDKNPNKTINDFYREIGPLKIESTKSKLTQTNSYKEWSDKNPGKSLNEYFKEVST